MSEISDTSRPATIHGLRADHGTVPVAAHWSFGRKLLAFLGPGYLVAVGYMDPGNWATSLAGGSKFGYTLLSVVLLSSLTAILLQALTARLAVATGKDLAETCRETLPAPINLLLFFLAEIAIIATDIAEVIGTAIGLQLLFGWPLPIGIAVTALDALLILALQRYGFRTIEAVVIGVLALITFCFVVEIALAKPDWNAVFPGLMPSSTILTNPEMLYLALGILGATVMPHNLYLHSGIVQTRVLGTTPKARKESLTFATIDSTVALCFAFLINASILILSAATFHANGKTEIAELSDAHALLEPLLGTSLAPILFAIALIGCGLNATVTATLAGQIVFEGFLKIAFRPWVQRLVTRLIAVGPAAFVAFYYGNEGATKLLVFSQVVLSLQLPFAIVPLVIFTASKKRMGALVAPRAVTALAGLIAIVIIGLNVTLVMGALG